MWLVLIVKLLALGYAALDSLRARFGPGVGAIGLTATWYAILVAAYCGLPPLAPALDYTWVGFVVAPLLAGGAAWAAWRVLAELATDEPRAPHLERAAMGLLANALLDAAVLVLVVVGGYLMSRSDF